jgi:hypothetical protein
VDGCFLDDVGGGRESDRSRSAGSVFGGRLALLNRPIFYVVYHILNSGSFTTSCLQTIVNGVPDP